MIIFAEMRALFASPRDITEAKFGFTFNNNSKQQEADLTSRDEKTLQGEVSDVTIEAEIEWRLMVNSLREY